MRARSQTFVDALLTDLNVMITYPAVYWLRYNNGLCYSWYQHQRKGAKTLHGGFSTGSRYGITPVGYYKKGHSL